MSKNKSQYLVVTEFKSPYREVLEEWSTDTCEVYDDLEDAMSDADLYTSPFGGPEARATIYKVSEVVGRYPKPIATN